METNEILDRLPKHLMNLVIDQPYNEYTSQDHAVWRYVMKRNINYLSKVAHESYVSGLSKTGISLEQIPHMYGMNRILKEIGWAAVAVDGFIPPAAFMEFQAYNVLVIAADIRPIDQINYTPAPDIIHEAAGHAPIIADDEYAAYLRKFGEIGHKAFSSSLNYKIYEAIRHLSILKADPYSTTNDIEKAESELSDLDHKNIILTEMSRIRNLHWWTVEYGLIGSLTQPKIYGAGLLSSIGESVECMKDHVKKIPYTVAAADYKFDITTMQPQLFVTPDFKTLNTVLDEFSNSMSLQRGGLYGIWQAIESENTATAVYSSGLQVSGTFTEFKEFNGRCAFIKTHGPSTLNHDDKLLEGHGPEYHKHGFSSPVGKLHNSNIPIEIMSDTDLKQVGIEIDHMAYLRFESGVEVKGNVIQIQRKDNKVILISFSDCTVSYKGENLFLPDWGIYDMAVGEKLISIYSGPVDPDAFGFEFPVPKEKTHKIEHSEKAKDLHLVYQKIRDIRDGKLSSKNLDSLIDDIIKEHTEEWLLYLEIFELTRFGHKITNEKCKTMLQKISASSDELKGLIDKGISLFS
jgi:phenylalanine-4-hydroxylase